MTPWCVKRRITGPTQGGGRGLQRNRPATLLQNEGSALIALMFEMFEMGLKLEAARFVPATLVSVEVGTGGKLPSDSGDAPGVLSWLLPGAEEEGTAVLTGGGPSFTPLLCVVLSVERGLLVRRCARSGPKTKEGHPRERTPEENAREVANGQEGGKDQGREKRCAGCSNWKQISAMQY